MNKELFVSSTPHETKVAVVEDDSLAEIYFERDQEYTLAGSIYKGRVTRVLPGMQSAFVDIGLERDAFLYVTDFLEETDEQDEIEQLTVGQPRGEGRSQRDFARSAAASTAEVQPHLIHPEAPPQEFAEEEEGSEEGGSEAGADSEAGEEGVRRWRGRRRRGRGRRGRFEGAANGKRQENPAPIEASELAPPLEAAHEDEAAAEEPQAFDESERGAGEGEETEHEETEQAPFAHAGVTEEQRERPYERRERGFRGREREGRGGRGRESFGPPAGYQPIVLPGESIAKYGRGEQGETSDATAQSSSAQREAPTSTPSIPSFLRRRPSTEVEDITQVREVRAADQRRSGQRSRSDEPQPRSEDAGVSALAGAAPVEEMKHGPGVERLGDDRDHEGPLPVAAEPEQKAEAETAHTPAPQEEHRFEQMNVASVFGGEEAEEEDQQTDEESRSEFASGRAETRDADAQPEPAPSRSAQSNAYIETDHASPRREVRSEEHAPEILHDAVEEVPERGAPGGTVAPVDASFAPGEGHVEEEEIEEEESEISAHHHGDDEEEDFEELEEEVLDRIAADQHQTRVQQLAEAVEESHVDERAIQADAPDVDEEQEEEHGEEEHAAEDEEHPTEYVLSDEAEPGDEHAPIGEDEEFSEEELTNGEGRAEMRAPAGTANFQQQRAERPQFDRRRRERGGRRGRRPGPRREFHKPQMISDLLKEGQEILVQIAKEPIGKKGARITSHIALPGRFLVYMPTVNHIGVSRKISSDEERQRLKRIVISERENGLGGFIVRTAADHAPEDELRADIRFLKNLWHEIKARAEAGKAPALIYHDLNLVERILRDQVNDNFTAIWVDTESDYERMLRFVNRFQPALVKRVKLYTKETPLFEQFNIQEEINKALKSKVWLKSGGYIVINQTEALVAIDVNTGKYVGKTSRLEDTIVKTNVDAIKEIVRQVRLRDLGGIIVIDFIDMDERRNRQKVMAALEEALRSDRAPSKVLQFNDFGLVAITRKRVKQSLERTLGAPCPYCTGTGFTKAVTTVCNEIWVEMKKMAKHFDHPDIMLRVNPEVAKALKAGGGRWIQEIEELTKRNLIVKTDPLLHQEQFDIN